MNINSKATVSFDEAEKDFSSITRIVEQYGAAIIMRDSKPAYLLTDFGTAEEDRYATEEELSSISRRLTERYHWVLQELAK